MTMIREWQDDGHRLTFWLTGGSINARIGCPHKNAPPDSAPCALYKDSAGVRRCIVILEAGGLGDFLEAMETRDRAEFEIMIEHPLPIEWRGRWDEDDVEFWWRPHGLAPHENA